MVEEIKHLFMLSLFCMISIGASAEIYSGSCGDNAKWSFDTTTGLLSITGSGNMKDYSYSNSPWYYYRNDIKLLSIGDQITSIGNYAFYYCSGLTSVTIPNSVTSIGGGAFYECSGLTSVTIPNSVTSIGSYAFRGCSGLTSVTIPNSVTSIGNSAFSYCSSLTSVTIPNSVTSIGDEAFYYCSGLRSVTIPNSVTEIGGLAFSSCSSLTSISVESGNKVYDSRDNCNAIIETASNTLITGCMNTTIPNSVTSIGNYAFEGCSGLTSVTIPNSVTEIGSHAFSGCSSLTSVTIPNSVTSIGDYAFSGCSGLTSVTIPNSVTSIGNRAFEGCSGLTSVTIPNSVTEIGWYAFSGCSGLTSVTVHWKRPLSIDASVWDGVDKQKCTLYVPEGTWVMYCAAPVWMDFVNIEEFSDKPETILATSMTIDKDKCECPVGETLTLTATVLPEDATDKSVTWSSDDESVATVADGVVTAVAAGIANITATTNDGSNLSASCVVTVTSKGGPSGEIEPSTDISKFTNVLYINDVETSQGAELTLPLNMKNTEENITAFECKVYLPEGVEWASTIDKRGNKFFVQPTFNEERTDANYHTINSIQQMKDGSYYVIVSSDRKEIILDKDGAILYLPVTVSEDIELGDYNIFVKNIVMVSENTEKILVSKTVSKLAIPANLLGDANNDGSINVNDITTVAAFILNGTAESWNEVNADVNCDGAINVNDITSIASIILGGEIAPKAKSISLPESMTIDINSTHQLSATILPKTAIQKVSWKSSNESIATVSQDGIVTGKAIGQATITATTTDGTYLSASCVVTVQKDDIVYYDYLTGIYGSRVGKINTGIFITNNYVIECEFQIDKLPNSGEDIGIWGTADEVNCTRVIFGGGGLYRGRFINMYHLSDWASQWANTNLPTGHYNMRFKDVAYVYNMDTNQTIFSSAGSRTFTSTSPLCLFDYDGGRNTCHEHIKIGHTKVYNGNTLLRDLRPCSFNGEIGMFDSVTNEFFKMTDGVGELGNWDDAGDDDNPDDNPDDSYDITRYISASRTGISITATSSGIYYQVSFEIRNNSIKTIHLESLAGVSIDRDLGPGQSYSITLQSTTSYLKDYYQTLIYTYNGKTYSLQV